MAKVVSMINLKGGVAKTTTTVQIAECLASEFSKKVLVIDLDPQTNASITLISEEQWEDLDNRGLTLFHLFNDKIEKKNQFKIDPAIQKGVSNLTLPNLSLLASSIRFIDIQDNMGLIAEKTGFTINPMEVLKSAVSDRLKHYDYVLIDCPPNLGFITRNGIEISDYYMIPTISDNLSTYGIPQIVNKIHEFQKQRSLKIKCLGLVITKFMANSSAQQKGLSNLPARFDEVCERLGIGKGYIFSARIPQSNSTAEAMDFRSPVKTFREKYGYAKAGEKKLWEHVVDLTKEFMQKAGA